MADILVIDSLTGEQTQRDYTTEEAAQRSKDQAADKAALKAAEQKAAADADARSSAIAHAKSLGFTDEMISVMYPGLTI